MSILREWWDEDEEENPGESHYYDDGKEWEHDAPDEYSDSGPCGR